MSLSKTARNVLILRLNNSKWTSKVNMTPCLYCCGQQKLWERDQIRCGAIDGGAFTY